MPRLFVIDDRDQTIELCHRQLGEFDYVTRCERPIPCQVCPERERACPLKCAHAYHEAAATLRRLRCDNVTVRQGDGYAGWPEEAPFDLILVTAAPEEVPAALLAQLKPGGRMVVPVGPVHDVQDLRMIEKDQAGRVKTRSVIPVRFVPLVKKRDTL